MFTELQLANALRCPVTRAALWHAPLLRAMSRSGITTGRRAAHFIAQIGHESSSLTRLEENLNYSAQRLCEVFPRYFTSDTAARFARNPQAIAERVYGGRMGNTRPGDGWRYRGRCPIQLTGADNYRQMQALTGLPLLTQPDLALQPEHGADIAAAWWRNNGLNALADQDDVLAVSRRINMGTTQTTRIPHGYADRVARTQWAKQALGVK